MALGEPTELGKMIHGSLPWRTVQVELHAAVAESVGLRQMFCIVRTLCVLVQ